MLCGARFTTDNAVSERSTPWQTFMLYYRGIVDATVSKQPTVLIDGLRFTEGPRWHDGRLYFSDMHAGEVIAVTMDGTRETIAALPSPLMSSGLGWLPDGDLLIVSMQDRSLMRLDAKSGNLTPYADLSSIATWHCNDMVVDGKGRAYVGNFGWDIYDPQIGWPTDGPVKGASLALVMPGKMAPTGRRGRPQAIAAAYDLAFPNGTVVTPDGKTLIVAESWGMCLTAFDILEDGKLDNRRTWAKFPFVPDGICLDAEGKIWVANPAPPGFAALVGEGGTIHQIVRCEPRWTCFAVALGGPNGRTLFMLEAKGSHPDKSVPGDSRVRMVEVAVGRAEAWP